MRPVLSLARLCTQALGSPEPTDDYIRKFCERAKDKLYVYDQTTSTTVRRYDSYALLWQSIFWE
jgi:hypothetical protein